MVKTIFISSFNPFILRNLLIGDALKIFKENEDARAVVFVPDYKVNFFRREIGAANIIIEGVKISPPTRFDIVFRFLCSSLVDTPTVFINKRVQLDNDGRLLRFFVSWALMRLFSRVLIFKKFVRCLGYLFISKNHYSKYFSRYQPKLVFATDVFNDMDIYLLSGAKSRRIKTVGMVRSWDNLTTKGMLRIKPDKLVVHNTILKEQAIKYNDFHRRNVFVSGIPQYDRYITGSRIDRKNFFNKLGLDPGRKLILFSPFGGRFADTDWQIMEILKKLIENKETASAQVLVRFTPNDPVSLGNFIPDENFYIDRPGRGFFANVTRDQELNEKDMDWLADCLYHSDTVVAGGASIGIDAAIFDKPTILIHFDGLEKKPYWKSVKRFLEYLHPRDIIKSGAMRSVKSVEELKEYLNIYLENPELDRPAREKMLHDQCWKLDGQAGIRIGKFILSLLQ